ncbi:hypothetical protein BT96DRAFT_1001931 [Gymnopus androsaceus JB14]|uniref:Uncharacterized protein n=1 Tax=Gymnopus androsaceus JB14 TaxID=1447944 RepID=A0A6A4H077_9AGAR|nr:hypothetical protein BT96DRAFT_1001931 [Gymnopus androsaceus JB14]
MTGQPNITDFRSYCPIEDAIAEAFETDNGPGPSNITQYRLHFGNNYQKSRWNKYIVSSMLAYTAARKEQYRRLSRRITNDDNLESTSKAKERGDLYSDTKKDGSRMNSQKHAKLDRRELGINLLQALLPPTANQFDCTKLERTRQVLTSLEHDGRSSEESDAEGGLIMMRDLNRDSEAVLDSHYCELRKNARPRPKHIHCRTGKKSKQTVKKKLPVSLYHRRFLAQLSDPAKEALQIPTIDLPHFNQWALAIQENSDSEGDDEGEQMQMQG